MITSKPMQLLLLFTIALIGACGLALLAVPFIGFGWHLFHGSFIASSGYRLPVPRDFYVSGDVQQPTMWKHGVGVPLFNRPFGMIGVRPRISGARFEFGNDLQNSSERMIAAARQEGLALRSVRTLSAGTGNAFCFEFVKLTEK
jgi:hypothetical protein